LIKATVPDLPFMDRMGVVFLITLVLAVLVSLLFKQRQTASKISMSGIDYSTSTSFNLAAIGVIGILVALYATWW
jgi:SSS family solute:Na+ symporter